MVPWYCSTRRRVLGLGSIAVSYSAGRILPNPHMRTTRKLPSQADSRYTNGEYNALRETDTLLPK
jgi:hypothetical protein